MIIIIQAKHSYENQLTTEHIEEAVFESGFDVTEILLLEENDVGALWAEQEGIPYRVVGINWNNVSTSKNVKTNKYGKKYNADAAKDRNSQLAAESDGMILFWFEEDKGSEFLIKDLKKANKRVYFHKPDVEFCF